MEEVLEKLLEEVLEKSFGEVLLEDMVGDVGFGLVG